MNNLLDLGLYDDYQPNMASIELQFHRGNDALPLDLTTFSFHDSEVQLDILNQPHSNGNHFSSLCEDDDFEKSVIKGQSQMTQFPTLIVNENFVRFTLFANFLFLDLS